MNTCERCGRKGPKQEYGTDAVYIDRCYSGRIVCAACWAHYKELYTKTWRELVEA